MTFESPQTIGSSIDNPENINPKFADAIREGEDGQLHLNEEVLAGIERDAMVRLTAEKIVEIDMYLSRADTPPMLRAIFEQVKRNHAKTVGGIEEITYH